MIQIMYTFTVKGKSIAVFPSVEAGAPVVYLNTFSPQGQQVWEAARAAGCPPFTLAAISGLDWSRDMAPWDCPPAFPSAAPCTGGADDYLELLTGEIIPEAEKGLAGLPAWRGIAGYSLAGLFALYALCRTDRFSRAASISGSLWFPGIKDYLFSHPPKGRLDRVFLSLGGKESKTRSPILRSVEQNTRELQAFYEARGIDTVFQLNPGSHYHQPVKRTAAALCRLARR